MPEYEIEELEPEIDLKDLFFHLLYRWRSILLVALICMIAVGGFQYYRTRDIQEKTEITEEEKAYDEAQENAKKPSM